MNKKEIEKQRRKYSATLEVVKDLDLIAYLHAHIEANIGGYWDLGEYSNEVPEFDQAVQVVQQALTVIITREFIKASPFIRERKGLE
jgi:hypothetical protein